MKIKSYILLFLAGFIMAACSHIDEDEQLIYVKPAPVSRCVLLEDFTGQRCVNCPKAAEEIEKLIEQYGEDAIITVSIHSGPLGFHTNKKFLGLSTDMGDDYYNHWNLEYQPVGLIDRGTPAEYTAWSTLIREELQKAAPVEIALELSSENNQVSVHVTLKGVDGDTEGNLQLWIIEDGITAFQMMPDGTRNDNYVHRHVFRDAVNGQWGDEIIVKEGYSIDKDYTFTISEDWAPENLSVVAFVYNNSGVLQVTKAKLINEEAE